MGKKRRYQSEILEDLLLVISKAIVVSKTWIMQRANLNHITFQKYFNFLVWHGYISPSNNDNGKYVVTESGKKVFVKFPGAMGGSNYFTADSDKEIEEDLIS
jgi:predicted transcriptional regulator